MSNSWKSFLLALIFSLSFNTSISAQEKLNSEPLQFRAWTGYSFNSMYFLGKTTNASSAIIGIGTRKAIRQYGDDTFLYYTADIIPYIYFDYPKRDDNDNFYQHTGFGFSPIGFLLEKPLSSIFSYQLSVSGSFILMETNFPTDKGRKLNFTFDPSLTIQTRLSKSFSFATGYKFHHISNAQTGSENPGLDSNFIFLSFILK